MRAVYEARKKKKEEDRRWFEERKAVEKTEERGILLDGGVWCLLTEVYNYLRALFCFFPSLLGEKFFFFFHLPFGL